ncbi:MAG: hypothetical protein U0625_13010 [Phycisphaerales bacterium]
MRSLLILLACAAAFVALPVARGQELGVIIQGRSRGMVCKHELAGPMLLAEALDRLRASGARVPIGRALDAYEAYLEDWSRLRARVDERCIALLEGWPPQPPRSLYELDPPGRRIAEDAARDRERIEEQYFDACAAAVDEPGRPAVDTARQAHRLYRARQREADFDSALGNDNLVLDFDRLMLRAAGRDATALARARDAFAPLRTELTRALERIAQTQAKAARAARALCNAHGIGNAELSSGTRAGAPIDRATLDEIARARLRGVGVPAAAYLKAQAQALRTVADALGDECARRFWGMALRELNLANLWGGEDGYCSIVVDVLGRPATTAQQRACVREAWSRWQAEWIGRATEQLQRGCAGLGEQEGAEIEEVVLQFRSPFVDFSEDAGNSLDAALRACGATWERDGVARTDEQRRALRDAAWSGEGVPSLVGLEEEVRRWKEARSGTAEQFNEWVELDGPARGERLAQAWIGAPPMDRSALRQRLTQLDAGAAALAALDAIHADYLARWEREVAALEPAPPAAPAHPPQEPETKPADHSQLRREYLDAAERVDASLFAALRAVGARAEAIDVLEAARWLGDARVESEEFKPGCAAELGGLPLNPVEAVLESTLQPADRDAALRALLPLVPAMRGAVREWRLASAAACDRWLGEYAWLWSLRPTATIDPEVRSACAERTKRAFDGVLACDAQAQSALARACAALREPGAAALVGSADRQRFPQYFRRETLLSGVVKDLADGMSTNPEGVLRMSDAFLRWARLAAASSERMVGASSVRPPITWEQDATFRDWRARRAASAAVTRETCVQRELLALGIERLREVVPPESLAKSRRFRAIDRLYGVPDFSSPEGAP